MGLLKKLKKKIFKGAKKLLKGAGKAFGSLMKNKFIKILAIGAALVFTAGAVAGAFPAFASTGFASALSGNAVTGAVFNAGASLTSGLAGAASATSGTLSAPTAGTLANPAGASVFGGEAASSLGAEALAGTGASVGSSTAANAIGGTTLNLGAGTGSAFQGALEGGGLLSKAMGAGKAVAGYIADKPGAAIVAGKIIQAAAAPKQTDELGRQFKRERQADNRFGINNYSGERGLDVTQDLNATQQIGNTYTGGLLSRVQAQRQQSGTGIELPGAYDPTYAAPPPIVYPNGA